jgi:predicted metal-dependent hydrolase
MRTKRAEQRPTAAPRSGLQLGLFDPQAQQGQTPALPRAASGAVQRYDDGVHCFDWQLLRSARRTLALRIDDRGVSLLAPQHASASAIAQFVQHHAAWVARKLRQREQRQVALQSARIDWADGAVFPYLGQHLTLRLRGAPRLRFDPARAELHLPLPPGSEAQRVRACVAAWMQQQARALFAARVAHYAARLGVRVAAVKLSAAATRWGSAKSDGSIRLHWRLLHFRPQLIDYVVAHEVAHLREMNHSPRFWAHVASLYPDYPQARSELRQLVLPPWD